MVLKLLQEKASASSGHFDTVCLGAERTDSTLFFLFALKIIFHFRAPDKEY